jgi:hypothetical protein
LKKAKRRFGKEARSGSWLKAFAHPPIVEKRI